MGLAIIGHCMLKQQYPAHHDVPTAANSGMTANGVTNHFSTDLKPAPKERIHVWYSKPGQKPTAGKVIDPKLKLRVVWLNGHVAKYLFFYVYTHRFVLLSTLVRETFYSRQQLTQRFLTSQSGCEWSALNGAAIVTTTPQHHATINNQGSGVVRRAAMGRT